MERPGIVHRLDKDTAGVMVIAKTDRAHRLLSEAFAGRTVVKRYVAVTVGKPRTDHLIIDSSIGRHPKYRHKMCVREDGREAVTELFLKKVYHAHSGVYSLFDVVIHTGRTHQIRVHLSSMGLPIVGDPSIRKNGTSTVFPTCCSHPSTSNSLIPPRGRRCASASIRRDTSIHS